MNVATTASRSASSFVKPTLAELWHTELQWSLERIQTAKELVGDMLRWPELYAFETPHVQAAREALEKAEAELRHLE
jgi:hypothetical protein